LVLLGIRGNLEGALKHDKSTQSRGGGSKSCKHNLPAALRWSFISSYRWPLTIDHGHFSTTDVYHELDRNECCYLYLLHLIRTSVSLSILCPVRYIVAPLVQW